MFLWNLTSRSLIRQGNDLDIQDVGSHYEFQLDLGSRSLIRQGNDLDI